MVVMTVALAGCGGGGEEASPGGLVVKGGTMFFDPVQITVQAGEEVTVTMQNVGSSRTFHNWVVLGASQFISTSKVVGGEEASVTFTIDQPGTYTVICDVAGHREEGMEGTLIVE